MKDKRTVYWYRNAVEQFVVLILLLVCIASTAKADTSPADEIKLRTAKPGTRCMDIIGQNCKCGPFQFVTLSGKPKAYAKYSILTPTGEVRGCAGKDGNVDAVMVETTGRCVLKGLPGVCTESEIASLAKTGQVENIETSSASPLADEVETPFRPPSLCLFCSLTDKEWEQLSVSPKVGYVSASLGTQKQISLGYRIPSENRSGFLAIDGFTGIEGELFFSGSAKPVFVPYIMAGAYDRSNYSFALTSRLGYSASTGLAGGIDMTYAVYGLYIPQTYVKFSTTLFQKQLAGANAVFGIGLEQSF